MQKVCSCYGWENEHLSSHTKSNENETNFMTKHERVSVCQITPNKFLIRIFSLHSSDAVFKTWVDDNASCETNAMAMIVADHAVRCRDVTIHHRKKGSIVQWVQDHLVRGIFMEDHNP